MVEDNILVWKFNRGSKDALRRIYEKFKDDLLGLAITLLRDRSLAEDVVHDVFVSFGGTVGSFHLSGTLKGYLSTCVANSARDRNRLRSPRLAGPDVVETACCESASRNPANCRIYLPGFHTSSVRLSCCTCITRCDFGK